MHSPIDEQAHGRSHTLPPDRRTASHLSAKEHEMKRFLIPAIIAGAIVSPSVFAESATHGKTREEVRAELVQARAAGVFDAPDATYPAAQLRAAAALQNAGTSAANAANADASSVGGTATGGSQSGRRTVTAPEARDSIYFGQ
jgi:hypothetical protein